MVSANQIREVVSAFELHGDPNRFVLEFSRLSFDIRNNGDPEAIQLACTIEDKIATAIGHGEVLHAVLRDDRV